MTLVLRLFLSVAFSLAEMRGNILPCSCSCALVSCPPYRIKKIQIESRPVPALGVLLLVENG
jgi:hypothetical protein